MARRQTLGSILENLEDLEPEPAAVTGAGDVHDPEAAEEQSAEDLPPETDTDSGDGSDLIASADNSNVWDMASRAAASASVPKFKLTDTEISATGANDYEVARQIVIRTVEVIRRGKLPTGLRAWSAAKREAIQTLMPYNIENAVEAYSVIANLIADIGIQGSAALLFASRERKSHAYAANSLERFIRLKDLSLRMHRQCRFRPESYLLRLQVEPYLDPGHEAALDRVQRHEEVITSMAKSLMKQAHGFVEVTDEEALDFVHKRYPEFG